MSHSLLEFLRKERGQRGVYSVCSSHHWVIEAAMDQATGDGTHLLLEATSNQVNHEGGYTGMRPADFVRYVHAIAERKSFPVGRLFLGGDHLGPNAWQNLPAAEAMERALATVREYVTAGFTKIHLDASMRCADDPATLTDETVAERAALMCASAEKAALDAGLPAPIYVIGTEVPPPGGATHALSTVEVTSLEAVEATLAVHKRVFADRALDSAWERVAAIVVQPGVEFDHDSVVEYNTEKAQHLQPFLTDHPELVFEAHSTDYQQQYAYTDLVRDGFGILKVGPALTFAMREALYALSEIDREMHPGGHVALQQTMEEVMLANPKQWQRYYDGDADTQRILRTYSYSDRIRYYWGDASAGAAVEQLMKNLQGVSIPETLLSQFLPRQYQAIREQALTPAAEDLVLFAVREVLRPYAAACQGHGGAL